MKEGPRVTVRLFQTLTIKCCLPLAVQLLSLVPLSDLIWPRVKIGPAMLGQISQPNLDPGYKKITIPWVQFRYEIWTPGPIFVMNFRPAGPIFIKIRPRYKIYI